MKVVFIVLNKFIIFILENCLEIFLIWVEGIVVEIFIGINFDDWLVRIKK